VAMTTEVKDELSRLVVNSVSARRAEVTSLLRFAGGLHIVGGRVVVEAEVACRIRTNCAPVSGLARATVWMALLLETGAVAGSVFASTGVIACTK